MRYEFERYFDFLDDLRESGVTNMFGASPYLIEEFGVDRSTAQRILIEWMRMFDERHPQEKEEKEEMNEYWIFTFGCGQKYGGYYVRIKGSFNQAREKMCAKYGDRWGFQYSEEEWEKMKNDPCRMYPMEKELEVIE